MLRKTLIAAMVLGLTLPLWADVYPVNGSNPQDITISLTIPCYTQVYWNSPGSSWDENDQTIVFNDLVQDGNSDGDFYRATADGLIGQYGAATQSSQDPWAEGYYESYDAALFWLDTNCDADMTLISGGNLSTQDGAELPTWYTIAFTNNTGCTYNVDCGFIDDGVRDPCGVIPMDGQGCYGDDDNPADYVIEYTQSDGASFWPNQFAFPMEDQNGNTTYTAHFHGHAQGTILFHARVLRSGMADPAGTYTTTLTVNFTNP